jgi:hypothetical protein
MTDRPTLGQLWSDARWGKVPGKPKSLTVGEKSVEARLEILRHSCQPVPGVYEIDWHARFVENLKPRKARKDPDVV